MSNKISLIHEYIVSRCSKLSLIRPLNSVMVGLGMIVGEVIAYAGVPPIKHVILGFLVGFFASAGIMALNDYFDAEIDKINAPRRPIPCGAISARGALMIGILGVGIAILLAFLQNLLAGIFATFTLILDIIYNAKLKRSGFLGNLIVSYSLAAPFIYGALALGLKVNDLLLAIAIMAFLSNLGREVTKGIIDVEGDRVGGVKTIAVVFGIRSAQILGALFVLAAVVISVVLPLYYPVNPIYYAVIPTTDVILLYATAIVLKTTDRERLRKAKDLMRLGMLIAMIIFIIMSLVPLEPYTRRDIREKAYLRSSSGIFST